MLVRQWKMVKPVVDLGSYDQLQESCMERVDVEDKKLCLIKVDGKVYVIDDTCSHAEYSLSQGTLEACELEVECYKHGAIFDITTGNPLSLPATKPVSSYNVEVIDGRIIVSFEHD